MGKLPFWSGPRPLYATKAARVFVSGMLSITVPVYLATTGSSLFFVGATLTVILAGNAFSNVFVNYFQKRLGRRGLLQVSSLLVLAAGLILVASGSPILVLIACFVGNISTTGTEAGSFQSIEAGVLPGKVQPDRIGKTFGVYNLIGYSASSLGAYTSSAPGYFGNSMAAFQVIFLVFAGVGLLLFGIYTRMEGLGSDKADGGVSHTSLSPSSKKEAITLSALFSIDAFGGSFVSQYVLATFFYVAYGVPLQGLGLIFAVTNVIAAASIYGAPYVARRIGNLRTMFYSHLASNAFLLLIPFAGSLSASLALLFCRQSLSQMDVPTRQAFMTELFPEGERVSAYATTNTWRSGGAVAGGPVNAAMFAAGIVSGPIFAGSLSKIVYDFLIFKRYRKEFK